MRLAWASARVRAVRVSVVRIVAVVAPVVVLVSGCTGSGAATASGSVTIAVIPGIDNAPLRVAELDGLFQQHGLTVTIRPYQTLSAETQALASGQVQIAAGDYTSFIEEQAAHPGSLRLIADGYDASSNSLAILTLPGSGITGPQQLQNQLVATPDPVVSIAHAAPYNIETLAAEEVLQNDGVSPSSVHWTQMSPQDMIGELHSGQVKAILASEPYILAAEEQLGAVEVMNASSGVTSGLPMSGYFSLASYAHANPSAVRAFQAALDQAQADCTQRGLVQAVLPGLTGMTTGEAALVTLGTYPATLNTGQVQRVAQLMYDSGMVTSPVNMSTLITG